MWMWRRPFWQSLRGRLILIIVLAALPVIGAIIYAGNENLHTLEDELADDANALARLIAIDQRQYAQTTRILLTEIAPAIPTFNKSKAACDAYFANLNRRYPFYANIGLIDSDADIVCSGVLTSNPVNVADRPYFQRALQTRSFSAGDYQVGRITNEPVLVFILPIFDEASRLEWMVFAAVDLDWLRPSIEDFGLPEGTTVTLVDSKGVVIQRFPDTNEWVGKNIATTRLGKVAINSGGSAIYEQLEDINGTSSYVVLNRLEVDNGGGSLVVSVAVPPDKLFAPARTALLRQLVALAGMLLLGLGMALISSRLLIIKPVQAILGTATHIGSGDLGARTGVDYRAGEIGQLAQEFDAMAVALEQRHLRLQTLFTAAHDAILFVDDHLQIIDANLAALRLLAKGKERLAATPLPALLSSMAAQGDPPPLLAALTTHPQTGEFVLQPNGEAVYLEYQTAPHVIPGVHLIIWHDVSDRKRSEAERLENERLRLALDKEKTVNEMKSRFVSMASHEFRNPLAAIQLSSGTLATYYDRLDAAQRTRYFERIQSQIEYMLAILDEMMMLGRADVNSLEFHPEPLDFRRFCEEIISEFLERPQMAHRLHLHAGEDEAPLAGDKKLLRQVLSNLLSNAIKYSPAGSLIHMTLEVTMTHILFTITDQGIGIPAHDLPHLFEAFFRASNVDKVLGNGLGLAITKQCIDLHHGTIEVSSEVNKGTTFIVKLPRKQEPR